MDSTRFNTATTGLGRQVGSARVGLCAHLFMPGMRLLTLELYENPGAQKTLHPHPYLLTPRMAATIASHWMQCAAYIGPDAIAAFYEQLKQGNIELRKIADHLGGHPR